MGTEWIEVVIPIVTLAVGLCPKNLLDLDVAYWIVKTFYRIPVRWFFRQRYPALSGQWEEAWETNADSHKTPQDRHSHPYIRQLGPYLYAEHFAKGIKYEVIGRIHNGFLVGHWSDLNDSLGYFGTFQLRIINGNTLDGRWIGQSVTGIVNTGEWKWLKLEH